MEQADVVDGGLVQVWGVVVGTWKGRRRCGDGDVKETQPNVEWRVGSLATGFGVRTVRQPAKKKRKSPPYGMVYRDHRLTRAQTNSMR